MLGGGSDGLFGSDDAFPGGGGDDFAVQVTGQIGILAEGDYVFGLNTDDGARLLIDDQLVIFEDGAQGSARNAYGHLELSAGTHSLDLVFFHQDGSEQLELFYFDGAGTRFLATAVPEPASIVLMGLAALCAAGFARRRRRRARAG